jgi:hypothetical protein
MFKKNVETSGKRTLKEDGGGFIGSKEHGKACLQALQETIT